MKELTVKRTPRKRQFQCPICDKFLSSAANLRRATILKSLFCACQLSKLGVKFINLFIMHKMAHQDLTLILYYRKFNAVFSRLHIVTILYKSVQNGLCHIGYRDIFAIPKNVTISE